MSIPSAQPDARPGEDAAKKPKFSFKAYLSFFTRFPIPWWLFLLSMVIGFANTEVVLAISEYTIRINKGELYNAVIVGFAIATVLNALLSMVVNVASGYGSAKVTLRVRQLLWHKILRLPLREVERHQPSTLISGVTNDVTQVGPVVQMAFSAVVSLYSFFRCCWEMYSFNGTLSVYMLMLLPLAVVMFALVGHLQYQIMKRRYASLNKMTTFFSEHISAAKHIKAQAMEDLEVEEGIRAIDARYKADVYYAFMSALQVLSNSLYINVGTVVTAVCGSDLIRRGQMPETGINDFSTYKDRVDMYTAEVLTHYQTLKGTQGALQYVGVLLDGPEEEPDAGDVLPSGDAAPEIRLENVSFAYVPDQPVLRDLSFTIPAGKMTAVIGGNGSGKSTLLKLLQGIYAPDGGHIWLGGQTTDEVRPHDLRRQFGYILQDNPLISGTVRDNIAYGAEGEPDQARVERAARLADADDFIRQLPQGYDTQVGAEGTLLSGGQRQRVAIARALYTDPACLLMDEAGANLDRRSDATILDAVCQGLGGHTIVVVTHDMRTVMAADYVVVLDHGTLEAAGTNAELARTSPTYRAYLEKQGITSYEKGARS